MRASENRLCIAFAMTALGACTSVYTGPTVIGTDLPPGPVELKCETYGNDLGDMADKMNAWVAKGWRVAHAVQKNTETFAFAGLVHMGKSRVVVCYVPPLGGKLASLD